jgi:hypothetical protein
MNARLMLLLVLSFLVMPRLALAQDPNYDDLPGRAKDAIEAPVHRQWGRTATNVAGTGVGGAAANIGVQALLKTALMATATALPKALVRALPFGGGLIAGALTQKFLQGKIEWGPLLASAGGAALALAVLNPATFPLALGVSLVGGVAGEAAWHGLKTLWKDRNDK